MSVPTYYQEIESPAFAPVIPMQARAIRDITYGYDYELGVHELLLSGSVGSAKSLVAAHLVVNHCKKFKKAHVGIGRLSMPALKDTLFDMIIEHIGTTIPVRIDRSRGIIKFLETGSKITCISWSDKKYKKVRSYAFSAFVIEEQTENNTQAHYKEIIMRIGRIPHIKECWLLTPTNPDSPAHWCHEYFIEGSFKYPTRHVLYSLTEDNPFLPASYVNKLKETMTKKEADRMLRGLWVEIDTSRIYYQYESKTNFKRDVKYKIDPNYPVDIFFDFNVAVGKPFSCGLGQVINGTYHIFKEFHIEGMRTGQMMEEISEYGIFELPLHFRVFGDASGANNDTRSLVDDYQIIEAFINQYITKENKYLSYSMEVPRSNPPLRRRQNLINGLCKNDLDEVKFYLYMGCEWIDKGYRLTSPVKGSDLIEDDKLAEQHITTAIGYWADMIENRMSGKKTTTKQL